MKLAHVLAISSIIIGASVAASVVPGCNATSAQISATEADGFKLAGCVLSQVFGGDTDPGGIASQCAGALPALIVDVINDFEAKAPDAGDVAASVTDQHRLLEIAKANAIAALARQSSSK